MRNDDLALCLWAHDVWGGISRKPLEIETWVQRTTNRKWPIPSPMVTWPMTSLDPERSRSWPRYVWCPLSRKWLEIATWWQWSAYRKWAPGNRIVAGEVRVFIIAHSTCPQESYGGNFFKSVHICQSYNNTQVSCFFIHSGTQNVCNYVCSGEYSKYIVFVLKPERRRHFSA